MTTPQAVPRYLWPLDHQRTGAPMGHRYPHTPNAVSPPRVYPHCAKCGAWVLSRICDFCSTTLPRNP
jgi:hypothetical protein